MKTWAYIWMTLTMAMLFAFLMLYYFPEQTRGAIEASNQSKLAEYMYAGYRFSKYCVILAILGTVVYRIVFKKAIPKGATRIDHN